MTYLDKINNCIINKSLTFNQIKIFLFKYNKKIFNTFNYRKHVFLRFFFFFLKNFLEYFISYGTVQQVFELCFLLFGNATINFFVKPKPISTHLFVPFQKMDLVTLSKICSTHRQWRPMIRKPLDPVLQQWGIWCSLHFSQRVNCWKILFTRLSIIYSAKNKRFYI